jgi:sensor histidine kinase YesM
MMFYGRNNWGSCMALLLLLCGKGLETITMARYSNSYHQQFSRLLEKMSRRQMLIQTQLPFTEDLEPSMSRLYSVSINFAGDEELTNSPGNLYG